MIKAILHSTILMSRDSKRVRLNSTGNPSRQLVWILVFYHCDRTERIVEGGSSVHVCRTRRFCFVDTTSYSYTLTLVKQYLL